jgi:NTP pyrophosphatase (non-canonical NTP hydrolase)
MDLDLSKRVAEIVRNVGREFPAPPQEMVLRQAFHLIEEARELVKAMHSGALADIRDELADVELSSGMLAHYLQVDLTAARNAAFASFTPTYPDILGAAADLVGPVRRYLGIARRNGSLTDVVLALGTVLLTNAQLATNHGISLDVAIEEKSAVVLSRGWREVSAVPSTGTLATVTVVAERGTPVTDVKR